MYDELDANYFAFKANNILKTKIIRIENLKIGKFLIIMKMKLKKNIKKLVLF